MRRIAIIVLAALCISCSGSKMMLTLESPTNDNALDVAEHVFEKNNYTIASKSENSLRTEFKYGWFVKDRFRYRAIVEIGQDEKVSIRFDKANKRYRLPWTITAEFTQQRADNIIEPLVADFKARGIQVSVLN